MKLRARRLIQILTLVLIGCALWLQQQTRMPPDPRYQQEGAAGVASTGEVDAAFASRASNVIVTGTGRVLKVLPDDRDGSRHQRFIIGLDSGLTVLVAHNIDVAPRVPDLAAGGLVDFRGEYEWNDKGGVVHWTHRTQRGDHEAGWLEYRGKRYQ